jgi:very-short-patch-repair endonuclease
VDFVAVSHRAVVEFDGGQHAEQDAYDAERTAGLEAQGFRVLRSWNDAALRETEAVVAAIQDSAWPFGHPR